MSGRPTTLDKLKMGALMGSSVGLCVGRSSLCICISGLLTLLISQGGVHLLRHGPGRQGVIRTLGTTMLSSAATFGLVLAPYCYFVNAY
ncbi:hypothetical protein PMAC_002752 [Pneumocystis sp. 'macacae']|nr:hypothetical protein PMAC_002752 [Pneumocystis sp. 'macacae']